MNGQTGGEFRFTILTMPWADLRSSVKVGSVEIWPFWKEIDSRVVDPSFRSRLKTFFSCFRQQKGDSLLRSPSVCLIAEESDREALQMREQVVLASSVLTFANNFICTVNAIGNDNPCVGPSSSDRFQVLEFDIDGDFVCFGIASKHGAVHVSELEVRKPYWLIDGFGDYSKEVIGVISDQITSSKTGDVGKVADSLHWFALAHTNSELVSDLTRLSLMAVAFESLLQNRRGNRRKVDMMNRIQSMCNSQKLNTRLRSVSVKRGQQEQQQLIPQADWFLDFYDLRSDTMHGACRDSSRLRFERTQLPWVNHLVIADLVYAEILLRVLDEQGFVEFVEEQFGVRKTPEMLSRKFGFHKAHSSLGWLVR